MQKIFLTWKAEQHCRQWPEEIVFCLLPSSWKNCDAWGPTRNYWEVVNQPAPEKRMRLQPCVVLSSTDCVLIITGLQHACALTTLQSHKLSLRLIEICNVGFQMSNWTFYMTRLPEGKGEAPICHSVGEKIYYCLFFQLANWEKPCFGQTRNLLTELLKWT